MLATSIRDSESIYPALFRTEGCKRHAEDPALEFVLIYLARPGNQARARKVDRDGPVSSASQGHDTALRPVFLRSYDGRHGGRRARRVSELRTLALGGK